MSRDSKKTRVMRVSVEFEEYIREANRILGIRNSDITKIIAKIKPIRLRPLGQSIDDLLFDSGIFVRRRIRKK